MNARTTASRRPAGSSWAARSHAARFWSSDASNSSTACASSVQSAHSSASLVAYRSATNPRESAFRHASSAAHGSAGASDESMALTERRPRHSSICTSKAALTTQPQCMRLAMSEQWNMMADTEVRPSVSAHEKWFLSAPTARQFVSITSRAR